MLNLFTCSITCIRNGIIFPTESYGPENVCSRAIINRSIVHELHNRYYMYILVPHVLCQDETEQVVKVCRRDLARVWQWSVLWIGKIGICSLLLRDGFGVWWKRMRVYESRIKTEGVRKFNSKWINRVDKCWKKEDLVKEGVYKCAERKCWGRKRWRYLFSSQPL